MNFIFILFILLFTNGTRQKGTVKNSVAKSEIETRIRFSNFTLVVHDFTGFDNIWDNEIKQYRDYIDSSQGISNEDEKYNNEGDNLEYIPTLIAKADTIHFSEGLGMRINNSLLEVIPNNKNDRFEISHCYLTLLNEIMDYRNHSDEELNNFYETNKPIREQSKYNILKDSASYFFRALPHMEEVAVVNGEFVPVKKRNIKTQQNYERKLWEEELKRIKKKYQLKDTMVVIPGEYDTIANLTKDGKLFGYGYESFLFRIKCFRKNKLIETRYVQVGIMYGC